MAQLVYNLFIALCFTSGERKIRSNIKKSQNIMTMIVFCVIFGVYDQNLFLEKRLGIRFYLQQILRFY